MRAWSAQHKLQLCALELVLWLGVLVPVGPRTCCSGASLIVLMSAGAAGTAAAAVDLCCRVWRQWGASLV